jgi:peroxin-16
MHVDTSVQDYLLSKAMTTSSVKLPVSLIPTLSSSQDWLGEIIYILRPLVYGMGQDDIKIVVLTFGSLATRP